MLTCVALKVKGWLRVRKNEPGKKTKWPHLKHNLTVFLWKYHSYQYQKTSKQLLSGCHFFSLFLFVSHFCMLVYNAKYTLVIPCASYQHSLTQSTRLIIHTRTQKHMTSDATVLVHISTNMRLSNWTNENESRMHRVTSFPCCNALRYSGLENMSRTSGARNENKSHGSITAPPSDDVTPAVHHTMHPSAPKKKKKTLLAGYSYNI